MLRCTVVIPALNEPDSIRSVITRLNKLSNILCEYLVIVDSPRDETIAVLKKLQFSIKKIKILINSESPGFSNAIKLGFKSSNSQVIIVMMADGSDDPNTVPSLVELVEGGAAIGCASRYSPGGQSIGGPFFKRLLSKFGCRSYQLLTRVGTTDCTNNFKAYSRDFIKQIEIEATDGFEIAMELIAKAQRKNLQTRDIPTFWTDRSFGKSKFRMRSHLYAYLKWYLYGIGIGKIKK